MSSHAGAIAAVPPTQAYAFLAQPPPQKKQPYPSSEVPTFTQSENGRRRSLAAISNWATSVQPGPPAPVSPNKTAFVDGVPRSSKTGRRHSVQQASSLAPPTPVSYLPESPTSSEGTVEAAMKPDLQTLGYTSVFVKLPNTPPANVEFTPDGRVCTPVEDYENSQSGSSKKRFKSLSIKPPSSSRSKSISAPAPTPKSKPASDKKAKYADTRPALLAQELALAQFMGGGKVDYHMKQHAEKQAKKAGATKNKNGQLVGVTPVWQDGQGGIWRDQEEEVEYTHLLSGADRHASTRDTEWVRFDERRGVSARNPRRRGSISTDESELDPTMPVSRHHGVPQFNVDVFAAQHNKSRRRPEPLNLVSPHDDASDPRREFLESSYVPHSLRRVETLPSEGPSSKKSVISNMKGMFKSKKSKAS